MAVSSFKFQVYFWRNNNNKNNIIFSGAQAKFEQTVESQQLDTGLINISYDMSVSYEFWEIQ